MENISYNKLNSSSNIVFEGKLTTQSMQRLDKQEASVAAKKITVILAITIVCGITLLFLETVAKYWAFIVFCAGFIASTVFSIIVMFTPHYPLRVEIKEDTIHVESTDGKVDFTATTKDVKKVYEYPECYLIVFRHKYPPALCQKNLIVSGTIEDFEEVFKDLIVRTDKK